MRINQRIIYILLIIVALLIGLIVLLFENKVSIKKQTVIQPSISQTKDESYTELADIRAGEVELYVDIPKEIISYLNCTEKAYYGYYSIDLNEDREKEFIVSPGDYCGKLSRGVSGNGPFFAFQKINGKWEVIGEFEGNSLAVISNNTNGYYDITSYHHMSAVDGVETLYKYKQDPQATNGKYFEISHKDKSLDSLASVRGEFQDYYIGNDSILFYRSNGMQYNSAELSAKEAPYLFANLKSRYLKIYELKTNTKEKYYLIALKYSDHGGLASDYALVYSPDKDEVLYETNNYLKEGWYSGVSPLDNGDFIISYKHTQIGWGWANKLQFYQYYRIDTNNGTVGSVNTQYKPKFEELLNNLKDECITKITSRLYKENEKLTFEQVLKEFGEKNK